MSKGAGSPRNPRSSASRKTALALSLIIPASLLFPQGCSDTGPGDIELLGKAADRIVESVGGSRPGGKGEEKIGLELKKPGTKASRVASMLKDKALIPPNTRISSVINGISDVTVNIVVASYIGRAETFFRKNMAAAGYAAINAMRADETFTGKWKTPKGVLSLFLYEKGKETRGAMVLPKGFFDKPA